MNKRAFYFGLTYSALVIVFKLFIVLNGYSLSKFGYYYSNILSVLFILPFYFLLIKIVRDKDLGGVIGGREAVRISLTLFAVSAVIVSFYNYFEFIYYGEELAINYYRSDEFLNFLRSQKNIKEINYPKIIEEQILKSKTSAFKATTGKLFSYLIIGISGAVMAGAAMKRSVARTK